MFSYNSEQHNDESLSHDSSRNLLAAILARALADLGYQWNRRRMAYKGPESVSEHDYRDAVAWLKNDSRGPFTFRFICEQLELDPQRVREFAFG